MYKEWGDLSGTNVWGIIYKVVDGDSVHIIAPVGEAGGNYLVKCRLADIDAPPDSNVKTAKIALENMIAETNGKVWCIFGKKEKYGRILVTLYGDPTKPSMNQRMILCGEAIEYHGGHKSSQE